MGSEASGSGGARRGAFVGIAAIRHACAPVRLFALLGGQYVRASTPRTATCNVPIALLISHLRSYHATWLSPRSAGRTYVPPRLEQPPVMFQSPLLD